MGQGGSQVRARLHYGDSAARIGGSGASEPGGNFLAFHLLSANDLKTLQLHNAHFSDDILASILNEPIKGTCFFWSAPDQLFMLPARILNFDAVGTDHPDAHATGASQDIGVRRFEGEARKAESELAQAVPATITTREKSKVLEFYFLPKDHPYGADMVACYKPRQTAQVAEKLDDGARLRFCSPNGQYVQDRCLDKALKSSGLVSDVQSVRASRNGQRGSGEYYMIPKTTFKGKPELRGTLILENE